MTLHAVGVPKWGLAMEEATLAGWLVAEGARIAAGDQIAELETSKIANVLEAPAAGTLVRQVAAAGEVKPLGALLAVIADAGEDAVTIDAFVAAYAVRGSAEIAAAWPEPVTAEVEGRPFRHLRLAPPEGQGSGRPVVLIHGFGGDHGNWLFNQGELARTRAVYAIDLPGHGGSSKNVDDGSLEAIGSRVEAWMATIGRGRVHLVGHSMGAAVAATLALDHPERVKSLTAINGVGFGGRLDRRYVKDFLAASRRKELKPVIERLFADPALVTREMLDGLVAARRIDGAAEGLRNIADAALSERSIASLEARLGALTMPLLRVVGSADRIVTDGSTADVAVAAAGHMPHLEAAARVNDALAAFLAAHD